MDQNVQSVDKHTSIRLALNTPCQQSRGRLVHQAIVQCAASPFIELQETYTE